MGYFSISSTRPYQLWFINNALQFVFDKPTCNLTTYINQSCIFIRSILQKPMHAVGLGMSACLANCKSIAKTWPKIHQPYGFKITVLEREWGLTYLYPQGLILKQCILASFLTKHWKDKKICKWRRNWRLKRLILPLILITFVIFILIFFVLTFYVYHFNP